MHFKTLRVLKIPLLLLLTFTLFIRCSYFFDEKKKETEIYYSEKTGTCVGQVNRTLKAYFDSEKVLKIAEADIDQLTGCYQNAIQSVIKYTKSGRSNSGDYKAENFDLLFKEMHPDANIKLPQLQYYIKLKQFLIGGKPDSVSKNELKIIFDILPTVTSLLKEMEPYRGILYRKKELTRSDEDYEHFNLVYKQFKFKVGLVLKEFEPYRSDRKINLKDFGQFILSEFYGGDVDSRLKYWDLMVSFKNLVLNESGDELEANDISAFAIQAILTYQALSQFEYFIRDQVIFTSLGTLGSFITKVPGQLEAAQIFKTKTLDSIFDVFSLLERVMTQSTRGDESQKISFDKLSDLLMNLENSGFTSKTNLSAKTLSEFLEKFSSRWFDPGSTNDPDITVQKIAYIRELVLKWVDRQKVINDLFTDNRQSISLINPPESLKNNRTVNEWKRILQKISVHQWDENKRLIFDHNLNQMSYEEMTVSNSIRIVVELFMRPFNVTQINALTHKVTEDQAQEVYTVMRILGVEMAFMDSRIFDSGRRGFGEGNNFSSQKKNDKYMDYYEGYEYLAIAMSSGRLAQNIYESVNPKFYLEYRDVHHEFVTKADGFREHLEDQFLNFFGHLKTVNQFWQSATDRKKVDFSKTIEIASRAGVISEKPFDLGEIRTVSTILYYLESIFNVFDLDKNGLATGPELIDAEKHFRSLMVKFILDSQQETLKIRKNFFAGYMNKTDPSNEEMAIWLAPKVFIYLLEYGEIPKGFSIAFWNLMSESGETKKFNNVEANALDVLRVFSVLAKINHDTHVKSIRDFLVNQHGYFKKGHLIQELKQQKAPDCSTEINSSFCQWARVIYCNETMNDYLYDWMSTITADLFPDDLWKLDTDIDIRKVDKMRAELPFQVSIDRGIKSSEEFTLEVQGAALRTMKIFEDTFRTKNHQKFSTLCDFPQLDE